MDKLVWLEHKLHGSGDPNEIVMGALRAGCAHYDAEWCGVLDADLEVGVFTSYWWYTPVENDRTTELFREFEFSENFPRWVEALKNHDSIVVPDIEAIRESQPEEYASYRRLEVEAVIGAPYQKRSIGFLAVKNPKRYRDRPEFLQMLSYVVVAELNERKLIESAKKTSMTQVLLGEKDVHMCLSYSAISEDWAPLGQDDSVLEELIREETARELLETLLSLVTDRQGYVLVRQYVDEVDQAQIAEELGTTQQAVSDIIRKAKRRIVKKYNRQAKKKK